MSQHDLDLQKVLATKLTAYSPSMFSADGHMRIATAKPILKKESSGTGIKPLNPLSVGDALKRIHTVFTQLKFDRNLTNMCV